MPWGATHPSRRRALTWAVGGRRAQAKRVLEAEQAEHRGKISQLEGRVNGLEAEQRQDREELEALRPLRDANRQLKDQVCARTPLVSKQMPKPAYTTRGERHIHPWVERRAFLGPSTRSLGAPTTALGVHAWLLQVEDLSESLRVTSAALVSAKEDVAQVRALGVDVTRAGPGLAARGQHA